MTVEGALRPRAQRNQLEVRMQARKGALEIIAIGGVEEAPQRVEVVSYGYAPKRNFSILSRSTELKQRISQSSSPRRRLRQR